MAVLPLLLIAVAGMSIIMFALWLMQRRTLNAGPVDVAWAGGIGAMAVFFAVAGAGEPARRWLVGVMTAIWALRLAAHLLHRVSREPEDGRYRKLRVAYGSSAQIFFFWFYQAQALIALAFALPPLVAMRQPDGPLGAADALGVAIWLIALGGEAVADRQLAAWRSDPAHRGKTCRRGLWRYSRHPNYFFEWVHWWAYVAIAIAAPFGWLTLIGPLLMYVFLMYITGVPPTEARALLSRGEDFRAYQRTTSVFFPWFPRSESA